MKIPDPTYQRLIEHLQAHAPTDTWAAELLKELEREAKSDYLPEKIIHSEITGKYSVN
jgi:hypothetical protein